MLYLIFQWKKSPRWSMGNPHTNSTKRTVPSFMNMWNMDSGGIAPYIVASRQMSSFGVCTCKPQQHDLYMQMVL